VKDRIWCLKKFEQCFVGKDAVDLVLSSGIVESRDDAVRIGRKIAAEYKCVEHVTGEHEFEDDFLFYRFTQSLAISSILGDIIRSRVKVNDCSKLETVGGELRVIIHKLCFTGSDAVDVILSTGYAISRADAVQIIRKINIDCHLFNVVTGNAFDDDANLYTQQVNAKRSWSRNAAAKHSLAKLIQNKVTVKDHRYHGKKFKETFLGSDAVDVTVSSGYAESRDEAIQTLRLMNVELDLFEHVSNEHDIEDSELFYRFKH